LQDGIERQVVLSGTRLQPGCEVSSYLYLPFVIGVRRRCARLSRPTKTVDAERRWRLQISQNRAPVGLSLRLVLLL
jgi:hypothetical protein